jgi:cystathionine beta-lyase family protein involved in aluminum resistance
MDRVASSFVEIEHRKEVNQLRVLRAFWNARISDTHFNASTGYGYDDAGREKIEQMYAEVFGAEAAYVRIQIGSGTQAIAMCLFGILRPGDELLSVTGKPYDSLGDTIGGWETDKTKDTGSLFDFGVNFRSVSLLDDGSPDLPSISTAITAQTRMVYIQKSRGYTTRRSLREEDLTAIIRCVREKKPDTVIFVDNCYGEFVEQKEPCALGADLCAGSLIKNPGAGICPSGGYIVGKKEYVEKAASRASAPGLGSHVGPSLGFNRSIAQGLFLAPHVVAECVKGAVFASALFEDAGLTCSPGSTDIRGDIVQSIRFTNEEQLVSFCRVIQASSPVDSFVSPEPWEMPGYDCPVVMAAGTFIQGSSVELSADGPIKPPYLAYMQGGLVFEQTKLAVMRAVEKMRV